MKFTGLTLIGLFISCTLANPDGFLSINCGASENATDDEGLFWITDSSFIKTRNFQSMPPLGSDDGYIQYRSVAYFTNLRVNKYCYLLPARPAALYLVRAKFSYGGFEALNLASVFDLLIEGIKWTKVDLTTLPSTSYRYHEIILTAKSRDSLSLCLARNSETGKNNYVFISTIELRPLKSPMYNSTDFLNNALLLLIRRNFGVDKDMDYPKDPFDRIWQYFTPLPAKKISTDYSSLGDGLPNQPPVAVLQTAFQSLQVEEDMVISDPLAFSHGKGSYYFALYFCNINETSLSQNHTFQVFISDVQVKNWLHFTAFRQCWAVNQILQLSTVNSLDIKLRSAEGSDVGPFINAAEAYQILDIQNATYPRDVLAIRKIANTANVPDDWAAGDPCLPAGFSSTGVICNEDSPPRVIILNLTNMGLVGNIPPSIASLTALTQLLLGSNNLFGSIPDLSSLKNLTTLQLQNNQLTGVIPTSLQKLPMLKQLFLQNNKLDGEVPPGLIKPGLNLQVAPQSKFQGEDNNHYKVKSWIIGVPIGCLVLLIIVIFVILRWRHKHSLHKHRRLALAKNGPIMQTQHSCADEEDANEYHRLAVEYTEDDIKAATNNYSTIIGKGGFGSVFFGRISGYDVAVKLLSADSNQGRREFRNEVTLLSRIYHKNLVKLVGYCRQSTIALVYEYMHGGTLKDHLYGIAKQGKPLDWQTRLNIALQVAEGLLYLHQGCYPPIIHRDIKCTNILLDRGMSAKVADFGLSKLLDSSHNYITTDVKGTLGYLDPEYFETYSLNEKSDVYSFGVVLLEIISGQSPKDGIVESVKKLLSCGRLVDLMDSALAGRYSLASAWKVAEIAYICVAQKRMDRPKMSTIVKELEEAVALVFEDNNQSDCARTLSLDLTEMPMIR